MRPQDNKVMVLTPAGVGAIAVLRMRGSGVEKFLAQHFSRRPRIGRCVHADVHDQGQVIDDAVVVMLPDDLGTDINLHGGAWVVSRFKDSLTR